jgi:aryl-alcohol dehydrogenase-like predicted oxidoreductase
LGPVWRITPLGLDDLPAGWSHRSFQRHDLMDISFLLKDGRAAIRLATTLRVRQRQDLREAAVQTRMIGKLEVSAIGLGCMSMSQAYGKPDRTESERALHRALDVGYTFLDTASVYGLGHNEKLIGETLGTRRSEFVLASKCGIIVGKDGRRGVDCRPEAVKKTVQESLERLRTDVIELYYLHRRDPDVPIEDSVGALAECIEEGKIKYIGLSEVSSTTLRRAHAAHPITAVQSEYSLWTRDPENKVLAACEELGVGFVPFSPLGRAFLSGQVTDMGALEENDLRQRMPRFRGNDFQRNLGLLEEFGTLAAANHCTMAQLALAWLLAQGETLVPIPGTKHVEYAVENAEAANLRVSEVDLKRAGEIISPRTVSGDRYGRSQMISLDPEED